MRRALIGDTCWNGKMDVREEAEPIYHLGCGGCIRPPARVGLTDSGFPVTAKATCLMLISSLEYGMKEIAWITTVGACCGYLITS